MSNPSGNPLVLSWRSNWAHHAIIKQISKSLTASKGRETDTTAQLPIAGGGDHPIDERHIPRLKLQVPEPAKNDQLTVAIVGAGCAGIFVPMIFNKLSALLKELQLPDLSVNCEIFEASSEARLGGRVYTHKFSQGGPHDYYDVGAMRFPEVGIMKRQAVMSSFFDLMATEF